ncbi:hypothetical protein [Actinoallomurus soli]|uniref:hypothetical protein n=1 Tax=Actinoallomurus soli TaxID=2952535 RepID=UPI002091F229|nr:hypothetical protein [Actinoallomurus soli]MCO5968919.1 hypothetical protein [Actinoallomurus soli]
MPIFMDAFGLREFQLYVLAFMPYSDQVQEVLDRLHATRDEAKDILRASNHTDLAKMHHKVDIEISMMGAPEYERDLTADEMPESERLM